MEEFWFSHCRNYEKHIEGLRHQLKDTTKEFKQLKMERIEERLKNKEHVSRLMQLLKKACQERDEAKDQLQKMLNENNLPTINQTVTFSNLVNRIPPDQNCPLLKPTKANSTTAESNRFSETHNYLSHGSSQAYDFIDPVSNMKLGDWNSITGLNPPLNLDPKATNGNKTSTIPPGAAKVDDASLIIDNLAKGKDLPTKGSFYNAVVEAGQLLQFVVHRPLPEWRNSR